MAVMIERKRLAISEAATMVGVKEGTIWRWILKGTERSGKLRSFHVGGRRYIRESDLQEFIDRGNANPEEGAED
jgi:excisionase family DNA binding protein